MWSAKTIVVAAAMLFTSSGNRCMGQDRLTAYDRTVAAELERNGNGGLSVALRAGGLRDFVSVHLDGGKLSGVTIASLAKIDDLYVGHLHAVNSRG